MIRNYNGIDYECCDYKSHKDFTGESVSYMNFPSGMCIYASNFSQETLDSEIFPEGMTGVTFIKCNLDNVYIPPGNTADPQHNSRRRYQVQEDGYDWLLDENNQPVERL